MLICCIWVSNAQNLIAVQNNSTPFFFTSLDSAIIHAHNGDTLYLPGGNFALNTNIDKCIHIIGVGHNPDSTNAINPTNIIANNLYLITGSSFGSLIGVKLSGFNFGKESGNGNITNYTLGRCNINGISLFGGYTASNNIFYENIISGFINLTMAQSNNFYNNYFGWLVSFGNYSIIKNNIFNIEGYTNYLINNTYSTFENNVFFPGTVSAISGNSTNNIFNNNLFVENISFPFGNNTGINNIVNQSQSSIFVNQSGSAYSYSQDYHLQPTCPGKNAGRDGTDIGIYGGMFPWKEGSVPFNPHIQYEQVAPLTSTNGNLNVNIKVAAQDH